MKQTDSTKEQPLLTVRDLKVVFGDSTHSVVAVRSARFDVRAGRITGLVGESGSGKTTVARVIVGLQPAGSGSVHFDGIELTALRPLDWKPLRKRIQMVFQDPYRALNPSLSIRALIEEPLSLHFPALSRAQRQARVAELLGQVGLDDVDPRGLPAELSGGQRQRVGIARALAVEPEFLILDEPVSALDVSVQAQILNLLQDLQEALGLTCLFISHDLAVVEHLCHDVIVMNRGEVVEAGTAEALYAHPRHAYTRQLLAAAPRL